MADHQETVRPGDRSDSATPWPGVAERARPAGLEQRSPDPATCPFFRSVDAAGSLHRPVEGVDPANRCAAVGAPRPQSSLQQELVCLTASHVDCPRYERGMLTIARATPPRAARVLSRATLAALAILAVSASASLAFVIARGGLALPQGPAASEPLAAASSGALVGAASGPASARPSAAPTATTTARPTAQATVSPSRTAAPTPTPTPKPPPAATPVPPEPTVRPTAPPTRAPVITPRPVSDRYALLSPCSSQPDCWVYTIRTGDNLFSIGNYFGHSLETIYRLNPWTRTTPLRAGQALVLPPPTR